MVLAAHRAEVTERGRRRVVGALLTGAVLLVLYWAAWLLDRSLLASDTRPAYYEFEAAFALADAWLAFCLVAGARALRARRATALLWLLAAGGSGAFLLGILETFGAAYLGGEWQDVFAFGVLILVLVFRPTGLLGERVAG